MVPQKITSADRQQVVAILYEKLNKGNVPATSIQLNPNPTMQHFYFFSSPQAQEAFNFASDRLPQAWGSINGEAVFYSCCNGSFMYKRNIPNGVKYHQQIYRREELPDNHKLHIVAMELEPRFVLNNLAIGVYVTNGGNAPIYSVPIPYETFNRLLYDPLIEVMARAVRQKLTPLLKKKENIPKDRFKISIDELVETVLDMSPRLLVKLSTKPKKTNQTT